MDNVKNNGRMAAQTLRCNLMDDWKHLSVRRGSLCCQIARYSQLCLAVDCAMKKRYWDNVTVAECVPNCSIYGRRWNEYWMNYCFDIGGIGSKSIAKIVKVTEVDSEFTQFNGVSLKSRNRKFNTTNRQITLNLTSSNPTLWPFAPKSCDNNDVSSSALESKKTDDSKIPTTCGARARGRDSHDRQRGRAHR